MGVQASKSLLPWLVLVILGVIIAALQIGDGSLVGRIEFRVALFLGGAIMAVIGLLKSIAVATDPALRDGEETISVD